MQEAGTMETSTLYTWVLLGLGLVLFYFLACKLTKERVRKWAAKGMEKESELQIKRLQTFTLPLFVAIAIAWGTLIVFGAIDTLCGELPNKITGRWPVYEGTIVGWSDGYRGQKGAAMIQVGAKTKGYNIRNRTIQKGEMVGVTVRMACNGDNACILEYQGSGGWVREMYLPNYGREVHAVPKAIAMNLLGGVLSAGFVLKKMLRDDKASVFKSSALRNAVGGSLMALTLAGEALLCFNVLEFEKSWLEEAKMVQSQLFVLVLICANVLFCILATPKADGYRYWWTTAKEFFRELDSQKKQ